MVNVDRQPKEAKRRRHDINLLSWNIHDIRLKDVGPKTLLPEFLDITKNKDILCFQETKDPIKIANFRCFNSNRPSSRSGGVCIAVKNEISKGVCLVNTTKCPDIVAIRLKKHCFAMSSDIIIINVYDSPTNSSYKKSKDDDLSTLDYVSDVIEKIPPNNNILIVGDFNARIGTLIDRGEDHFDPSSDYQQHGTQFYGNLPPRSSKDLKINPNGRPFLDFVTSNNLAIMNGRTLGDVIGNFTCIKYNGCSLVDYVCSSMNMTNKIRSMFVGDLSYLSDHCPIHVSLLIDCQQGFLMSEPTSSFTKVPNKFKWESISNESQPGRDFLKCQNDTDISEKIFELENREIATADDVFKLNDDIISVYNEISSRSLKSSNSKKRTNRKKWFDLDCRKAKRALTKSAKAVSKNPKDDLARSVFHIRKKDYKRLLRTKRSKFLSGINKTLEDGKNINWKAFKDIKEHHTDKDSFDDYDLQNFYQFFKELYRKKCDKNDHSLPDKEKREGLKATESELSILNDPITTDELNTVIKKLKLNKSVSLDLISNEMIKYSDPALRRAIANLFNSCLTQGIYPWNSSVTTPLHKKGDKEDPDNYRAITVGSCLGKLFSSILLERLTRYRRTACPDSPNQLGFCPGSQTSDHVLVLKTILDKYVKTQKKRVYSCFVDYKKAFDRVCREALMYKITKLGVEGNFFNCLKYMYSHSKSHIKLAQKLSAAIDIELGTEQGHPMSPELFKIFVQDLTEQLNKVDNISAPALDNLKINHLLWADDLVLLATDPASLQRLLDVLNKYVKDWELEVNISKTNVMVFNSSGRLLKESNNFRLGDSTIKSVRTYCYLGILFSLNGSFKAAIKTLVSKAKRAHYQIKRTVEINAISVKSLCKLLDALIVPIVTYAVQVWLPHTNFGKSLLNSTDSGATSNLLQDSPKDDFELFHLRYIKWMLGLHRRAANIPCYGDTGRLPLGIKVIPQVTNYFRRAELISTERPDSFLAHAFNEQKNLKLEWFNVMNAISRISNTPKGCKESISNTFKDEWDQKRKTQNKLLFYNEIKRSLHFEQFLTIPNRDWRVHMSRIRSSAHDLRLESGRHNTKWKATTIVDKACRFCHTEGSIKSLELLAELPNFDPLIIIESEHHMMTVCPAYHHLRIGLSDELKCHLLLRQYSHIMTDASLVEELARFTKRAFEYRNKTNS